MGQYGMATRATRQERLSKMLLNKKREKERIVLVQITTDTVKQQEEGEANGREQKCFLRATLASDHYSMTRRSERSYQRALSSLSHAFRSAFVYLSQTS